MKITASIFVIMFTISCAFSQDKMIVDKPGGFPFYDGYTKEITSFNQLPSEIKTNTLSLLKKFLGDFNSNTHFIYGQMVNLKRHFDPKDSSKVNPAIPKYELEFIFTDPSIGVKSYPIEVRLMKMEGRLKLPGQQRGILINRNSFREILS